MGDCIPVVAPVLSSKIMPPIQTKLRKLQTPTPPTPQAKKVGTHSFIRSMRKLQVQQVSVFSLYIYTYAYIHIYIYISTYAYVYIHMMYRDYKVILGIHTQHCTGATLSTSFWA